MPAGEFENCTEDSLCGQFGNAVYDRGRKYSTFFWIFNSLTVFGYLVIYTNYLIRAIIRSEKKLRSSIGGEPVVFEDMEINVTVTVGMASRVKAQSIDEWIQCVDKKLYIGKTSGKNRMIE